MYDFGSNARHGIQRDLVRSERYDDDNDRRYEIDVLSVSASEGTPDALQLSDEGPFRRIRIGDPDRTITGQHTYTIDYTVGGAMLPFSDHDELYWDVIGHEWGVPIEPRASRCKRRPTSPKWRASSDPTAARCRAPRRPRPDGTRRSVRVISARDRA